MVSLFTIILSLAMANPCETNTIQPQLDQAKTLLFLGDIEKSQLGLNQSKILFHCQIQQFPEQLGQFYLLQGSLLFFTEHKEKSKPYFASASNMIPYDPDFGLDIETLYKQEIITNTISWKEYPEQEIWIDGKLVNSPITLSQSPHLIQIREAQGLRYSTFIDIKKDQQLSLPAPLATASRYYSPIWWIVPTSTAISFATMATLSYQEKQRFSALNTTAELEEHYLQRQKLQQGTMIAASLTVSSALFLFFSR